MEIILFRLIRAMDRINMVNRMVYLRKNLRSGCLIKYSLILVTSFMRGSPLIAEQISTAPPHRLCKTIAEPLLITYYGNLEC